MLPQYIHPLWVLIEVKNLEDFLSRVKGELYPQNLRNFAGAQVGRGMGSLKIANFKGVA